MTWKRWRSEPRGQQQSKQDRKQQMRPWSAHPDVLESSKDSKEQVNQVGIWWGQSPRSRRSYRPLKEPCLLCWEKRDVTGRFGKEWRDDLTQVLLGLLWLLCEERLKGQAWNKRIPRSCCKEGPQEMVAQTSRWRGGNKAGSRSGFRDPNKSSIERLLARWRGR